MRDNLKGLLLATTATLALTLTACAPQNAATNSNLAADNNDAGIVGGVAVSAADPIAASTVALATKENGVFCTGSLIAANVVITAGHCALATDKQIFIVFGAKLDKTAQPRAVVTGALHNLYVAHMEKQIALSQQMQALEEEAKTANDEQMAELEKKAQGINAQFIALAKSKNHGDVALLIFDGDIPAGFAPAALVTSQSQLKSGATATLAGFGATTMLPKPVSPSELLKTNVKLSDANYSETEVLFKQDGGRGACHGDSGGPAFITVNGKALLFGVTSRSATLEGGKTCMEGSIYSNLVPIQAWIKTTSAALLKSVEEAKAKVKKTK